jgi:hypothetical protein
MRISLLCVLAVVVASACGVAGVEDPGAPPTMDTVFANVLEPGCTFSTCHSAPTVAAKLDLSRERACNSLVNATSCLFPQRMLVVPGNPDDSFLMNKLTGTGLSDVPSTDCSDGSNMAMPFGASELPTHELALVRDWIAAGAQCESIEDEPDPVISPPTIASLTVDRAAPLAGELVTFTVTLTKPAPAIGQVVDLQTTSLALSAPVQVFVVGGESETTFDAFAERPTSLFTVIASTGNDSKMIQLRVAGIEVAEVLSDNGDARSQWIKIHNRTSLTLDLSGYRFQAGQTSYGLIAVALEGTIAPGSCALIGGPKNSHANRRLEFDHLVDFTPDLPTAGSQATGYAVFDSTAAAIGGIKLPVDTLLAGENNNAQLLGADGQIAAPGCTTAPVGSSVLRTGIAQCASSVPQPTQCP